jgi:hypothetical protein
MTHARVRRRRRMIVMLDVLAHSYLRCIVCVRGMASMPGMAILLAWESFAHPGFGVGGMLVIQIPSMSGVIHRLVLQALFMAGMLWIFAHLYPPADRLRQ